MKALVPSMGSSTHTYSAFERMAPNSSPMMPWPGNCASIIRRIATSAARSASVTGSNLPPLPLSLRCRNALREERQDRLAGRIAELLDEGCEINGRHGRFSRKVAPGLPRARAHRNDAGSRGHAFHTSSHRAQYVTTDPEVETGACFLCGARAHYCGAATGCCRHALLGRFLPRLGPLADIVSGPLSCRDRRYSAAAFRAAPPPTKGGELTGNRGERRGHLRESHGLSRACPRPCRRRDSPRSGSRGCRPAAFRNATVM